MVSNQLKGDEMQRQAAFDELLNEWSRSFNFDSWALAVRRQMLASLKKREGSRSNWE